MIILISPSVRWKQPIKDNQQQDLKVTVKDCTHCHNFLYHNTVFYFLSYTCGKKKNKHRSLRAQLCRHVRCNCIFYLIKHPTACLALLDVLTNLSLETHFNIYTQQGEANKLQTNGYTRFKMFSFYLLYKIKNLQSMISSK